MRPDVGNARSPEYSWRFGEALGKTPTAALASLLLALGACTSGPTPNANCAYCNDAGCGFIAERNQWVCCNEHDDPNPYGSPGSGPTCCRGFQELSASGCPHRSLQFYACIDGPYHPGCPTVDAGSDATSASDAADAADATDASDAPDAADVNDATTDTCVRCADGGCC
jgi:hypothetical protein